MKKRRFYEITELDEETCETAYFLRNLKATYQKQDLMKLMIKRKN